MLAAEVEEVHARRQRLYARRPALAPAKVEGEASEERERVIEDAIGLSLSGGGIRSATFSLGVVEALAAKGMLEQVDYLSTVSGGGYTGTFLSSYLDSEAEDVGPGADELPFRRSDEVEVESGALRHLRNHSKFLFEGGALDLAGVFVQYIQGALVNLVALMPALLGMVLVGFSLTWAGLGGQTLDSYCEDSTSGLCERWKEAPASAEGSEVDREGEPSETSDASVAGAGSSGDAEAGGEDAEAAGDEVEAASMVPPMPAWTMPVLGIYGVFILLFPIFQRLSNRPDSSLRKHGSKLLAWLTIVTAGIVAAPPLFVWAHVRFHALSAGSGAGGNVLGALMSQDPELLAAVAAGAQVVLGPVLQVLAQAIGRFVGKLLQGVTLSLSGGVILLAYFKIYDVLFSGEWMWEGREVSDWTIAGIVLAVAIGLALLASVGVDVNHTSLHRIYRDRLGRAYLVDRPEDGKGEVRAIAQKPLSELNSQHKAPYHLLNAALNLPGSKNLELRGRDTDFFSFSKRYCGSPILGYQKTPELERLNPEIDLGAAMAISGAAVSSQMGTMTVPGAPLLITLFNVRMGYWLRARPGSLGRIQAPGMLCLLDELRGSVDERSLFQNISDGGHLENLGVYELLRRQCRFVIAVDGEADPELRCGALLKLIRFAHIDLGVTIEIDSGPIGLGENGDSREHVALGTIDYGPGLAKGLLLYIKSSVTGNERDDLLEYRRQNPSFPHQSTGDQSFDEAQFEAYRSLGRHIGDELFDREVMAGQSIGPNTSVAEWMTALSRSLIEEELA
ncbi:patatin-like phospholipase family protein [Pseudenhygromyxa sp. WMMC2535]|nr:patatin-like phospholipase family protein [Pseudenhygromyxa sp. WMMC2535]NVB40389.1 patatin-like phospholipase family protein [Pseudenhygromyxa sp. WMMC2535]